MRRELASGSRLQVLACASGCDMAFAGEEQSARLVKGNQSNDDHSNVITNVVDHYASSRGGAHLGRLEIVGGLLDGLAGASLCDWFGGAQQSRRRRLTSRAMKLHNKIACFTESSPTGARRPARARASSLFPVPPRLFKYKMNNLHIMQRWSIQRATTTDLAGSWVSVVRVIWIPLWTQRRARDENIHHDRAPSESAFAARSSLSPPLIVRIVQKMASAAT